MEVQLLNEFQLARRIGMSLATVRRWRLQGTGPKYRKIGRSVRYSVDDLQEWIKSRPVGGKMKLET